MRDAALPGNRYRLEAAMRMHTDAAPPRGGA